MDPTLTTKFIPDALAKFDAVRDQIKALGVQCQNFVINSQDSLESAKELAKNAKKIAGAIEDQRKSVTKPLDDEKKIIMDYEKMLTSELETGVKVLRSQILDYEKEQERKRQEELARIEAERKAQEEELRKQMEASQTVNQEDLNKLQEIKRQQAVAITTPVKNSITKVWTFSVIDFNLVPRTFMEVDQAKVKAAIAAGERNIPGIAIYTEDKLTLR